MRVQNFSVPPQEVGIFLEHSFFGEDREGGKLSCSSVFMWEVGGLIYFGRGKFEPGLFFLGFLSIWAVQFFSHYLCNLSLLFVLRTYLFFPSPPQWRDMIAEKIPFRTYQILSLRSSPICYMWGALAKKSIPFWNISNNLPQILSKDSVTVFVNAIMYYKVIIIEIFAIFAIFANAIMYYKVIKITKWIDDDNDIGLIVMVMINAGERAISKIDDCWW